MPLEKGFLRGNWTKVYDQTNTQHLQCGACCLSKDHLIRTEEPRPNQASCGKKVVAIRILVESGFKPHPFQVKPGVQSLEILLLSSL